MKRRWAILMLATALVMPVSAWAHDGHSGDDTDSTEQHQMTEQEQEHTSFRLFKGRADKELDRRVGSLTGLIKVVNDSKCISDADKATLTANIKAQQQSIPGIKKEVDDEDDDSTEQEHTDKIHNQFSAFRVIVAQVHLMRVDGRLSCAAAKLTKYADKLQTHIDTVKADGKDTATLETTMTDMRAQIKAANDAIASARDQIMGLTAQQVVDQTVIKQIKTSLTTARKDLLKALHDGNTIKQGLVALGQ